MSGVTEVDSVDVSTTLAPASIGTLKVRNRIMMSPMCQHRANGDGRPNDWHLVHYGSRSVGNVGVIMLEDTAVLPDGRLGNGGLGLYDDAQVAPFKRVIDFCHTNGATVGVQIGHCARKAFLVDGIEEAAAHDTIAPSAIPFNPESPVPRALEISEIPGIIEAFVAASRRAVAAGVDFIEIHGAHGYLLHEFLSAAANTRQDEYGGDLAGRARLLLEVVRAVRKDLGEDMPLSVRLSATDLVEGGNELEDSVQVAKWLRDEGVTLIDVTSGGLTSSPIGAHSVKQPALAAAIREQAGIATVGVGGVNTIGDADALINEGACDIVGIGRALLRNPFWVREVEGSLVGFRPEPHEKYRGMD
ncbi:tRNA-dihydrouridine synthase [Nesterenkonia lutea]|uniref:2,4-dienoyl-CoA reductase-like NADH-dependent reductase (Old Yellow Enzyme family) n=1 Tax=Nesterenkonia lutea TaxID=272919 RepID=A0ABR9JHY1_9MICC|nr:tRNA-dihydrouridine synthase [Nesterenkonia lutea]MBE1525533.1 2,4-dienoyl-CoA reductase-like NADH-dependent reductase (Old Yellow Enzyme family) [Nesterenkonia lutea]